MSIKLSMTSILDSVNSVNNMLKRTITAVCIIVVIMAFIACGYFVSPVFNDLLIYAFLVGALYEMIKCLKGAGYKMFVAPAAVVLIASYPVYYCMQHYLGLGLQGLVIVFLVAVMLCLTIYTFKPAKHTQEEVDKAKEIGVELEMDGPKAHELKDLLANVFVIVYPFLFMASVWNISNRYMVGTASLGLFAVLYCAFVPVLGSDTFAYWFGSMIGGKKLCPKISPKKTVAGGIGGLFGGIVLSMVFWVVFEYFNLIPANDNYTYIPFIAHDVAGWEWKTALIYIAIGLICGAISELGDLAASRIKRSIGIKDYGNIFPGHGGFMDRVDSVMYCAVILQIAFTLIYDVF